MAQTVEGGHKTATTNKTKYGADFYKRIGAMGGSAPYKGLKGFAADRERARTAGILGGKISKRGKRKNER